MNNKVAILALVIIFSVAFSGCIRESNVTSAPASLQGDAVNASSTNLTPPSEDENKPEIEITSFSSIYMRDNRDIKDKYNISERYYAVYDIDIRNNGLSSFNFKVNELHLSAGDQIFNATILEQPGCSEILDVMTDLEKENKIKNATIFPGQAINGIVVFRVDSLYNKSFQLMYNNAPVMSPYFEKSIEAIAIAEHFNYSIALGIPPYCNFTDIDLLRGTYEPQLEEYPYIWPKWVNRSIFEFYKKVDTEHMLKSPPDNIPITQIVYALKVIPERNITALPVKRILYSHQLLVVDDAGEEIINKSSIDGIAFLSNHTYEFQPWWKLNTPQINLSNATIVQISFEGTYGWSMAMRMPFINQDIILDDKLEIIMIRYYALNMIS
ncbi:MAG: hypothetical protein MIO93_12590 [ANME-2 cluster archaeon]|nr:hypothetical protein [ANME-2 cluster archaeon]